MSGGVTRRRLIGTAAVGAAGVSGERAAKEALAGL